MIEKRKKIESYLMRIILVLTLIIILSCSNKKYNETLSNHFNTEQINDFEKINDFFISEALNGSKSNYKKEFQEFLEDKMFNGYDSFLKKIDFNKQKELYTTISKSSFDELWEFCKSRNRNKETFKSICLRQEQNTKFRSYLKELSKSNDFAKLCFTTMDDNGDYYMLPIQHYLNVNSESMDLESFDNQFIIAVFYLSENDSAKRVEKWTD